MHDTARDAASSHAQSLDALTRPDRDSLAGGSSPIYVATKLFDYASRWFSAIVEEALVRGLRAGLAEFGLRSAGNLAFLPFRDSNEALDRHVPDDAIATRTIYELDIAAMRRSFAVIALLNDPQKDSGVCFEVGYSAALGRPIVPVVNDFIDYRFDPWGWVYSLDPVLTALAPNILKEASIPAPDGGDRRRQYRRAQDRAIAGLQDSLATAATELVRAPERFQTTLPAPAPRGARPRVHIEFGGGLYEWQRRLAADCASAIAAAAAGLDLTVARRFERYESSLEAATRDDIAAALGSDLLVTLGDGPDMDAGAAAMQGLVRGRGGRVLLYYSGGIRWVTGSRDAEERNLMLQHSADQIVHALGGVPEAVQALIAGSTAG